MFIYTHLRSFHVAKVAKEYQTIEVEEAEPEYQEEQQPEFEISYQVADQDLEHDFTNSDTQQGKPRSIILTQCLTYILVL